MNRLWTPADELSFFPLWFDALDFRTVVLDVSNGCQEWLNKGGEKERVRSAVQATSTKRPLYQALKDEGVLGPLKCLTFDGTDDYLVRTGANLYRFAGASDATLFCVADLSTATAGYSSLTSLTVSSSPVPAGTAFYIEVDSITSVNQPQFNIQGSAYRFNEGILNARHLFSFKRDRVSNLVQDTQFYRNGTLGTVASSTNPLNVPNVNPVDFYIGASWGSAGGVVARFSKGRIHEIIWSIFPCLNTQNEGMYRKIEGYLAHKWGLVYRLPENHPYRSFPPVVCALNDVWASGRALVGDLWHNY